MDTQSTDILAGLEQAVADASHDAARMDALNALAVELMSSDLRRALSCAEQAGSLAAQIGSRVGVGRSLHHRGYCASRLGEPDKAHDWMAQALQIARETGDEMLEADCLHSTGILHLAVPDHAAALDHHLRALALYEKLDDKPGIAQTLNDIGNVYYVFDDFSRALSYYIESLRGREANGDARGVACSLNNIGIIHDALGDYEQALHYLLQCLETTRRTGYTRLEARCLANTAAAYRSLQRYDEALATIQEAVAFDRHHGYRDNEYDALTGWGDIYRAMGHHARAVPLFQEALGLAQAQSDRSRQCEILVSLAEAALGLEDVAAAESAFTKAAALGKAVGLKQSTFRALRGLSETREREGAFADALAHYKQFHVLEKEVFNESAGRRTQALMLQMNLENAQKEAALQRQAAELHQREAELSRLKNVELANANRQLQVQAQELKAQAKELERQAQELERQATHDGLTGLANRRSLEATLLRHFAQAKHSGTALSVVMADLDHFKSINDQFGHQVGDEVLTLVALIFGRTCAPPALIARYGGEEFALVLPQTSAAQARALCEGVRREVQEYAWSAIHPKLVVTISIGVSADTSVPNHERLLGLADARLYDAKRLGRNRVCAQTRLRAA